MPSQDQCVIPCTHIATGACYECPLKTESEIGPRHTWVWPKNKQKILKKKTVSNLAFQFRIQSRRPGDVSRWKSGYVFMFMCESLDLIQTHISQWDPGTAKHDPWHHNKLLLPTQPPVQPQHRKQLVINYRKRLNFFWNVIL